MSLTAVLIEKLLFIGLAALLVWHAGRPRRSGGCHGGT